MDKEDAVHIYNGVLLGHKNNEIYSVMNKNKIMPFAATWMPLEIITLTEVKSEKDKYHMISLICGI